MRVAARILYEEKTGEQKLSRSFSRLAAEIVGLERVEAASAKHFTAESSHADKVTSDRELFCTQPSGQ